METTVGYFVLLPVGRLKVLFSMLDKQAMDIFQCGIFKFLFN